LTRLILDEKSSCETLPASVLQTSVESSNGTGCWYPRKFSKAVIIVIDALRYDFTVPFVASAGESEPKQFHNAFPILYDTARTRPENAFLLPFIADPPTTTLQRLQGLTTGTLPTLIDAGSNFAATAIEEDNLLAQMRGLGKTMVQLGDDTWQSLFPGYFHENLSHPYDSFNVWDLHTVDNGVTSHLLPLLDHHNHNGTEWDYIFAHYLGVDHAGHRYGPDHPAMKDKLRQMNKVILQVMDVLDDDTVLVVMGDHGMDTKGDHGGESDDEVEATLWMYSTRSAFGRTHAEFVTPPQDGKTRPVRQIDLVSTLALLLGLPIPFNNIGAPIEEAFARPDAQDWRALALPNQIAVAQIQRYQEAYSKARNLEVDSQQLALYESALTLLSSHATANADDDDDDDDERFREGYLALRQYESEVLTLYRRLWANFNLGDMAIGLLILSGGLVYLSASAAWGPKLKAPRSLLPSSLWSWLGLFFTISQSAGFASNSYTIHEDSILLFFLTTFGIIGCASSLRQSNASDRSLGALHSLLFTVLTRVASFSRLCREEQMPACRSSFYASSNSSTSAPWQVVLPFVIAILLPGFVKLRYQGTASYTGPAGFWLGFCFRIGLLLIAIFWMLDAADNGGWLGHAVSPAALKKVGVGVARCVIGIAVVVGWIIIVWAKPCIDVSLTGKRPVQGQSEASIHQAKSAVVVLGYANIHGARYFLLLPVFILLVTVLLPPMGQFSIAICTCQILCLLEMLDTNGMTINSTKPSSASAGHSSTIGPIILAMLGSFHFFKTGHQASLASIQWNAAFVPFHTITYPWSPLLVVLNTFGTQILCACAVPLTVLWKRPVGRRPGWMTDVLKDVLAAMLAHQAYYATIQLATTLWAGHLRRHLMLYRVFMPRFLMSSALLVIVDVVLLVVAWSALRSNTLSVGEVMGY
jgi:GPI ethanolamine phosphate transferase 3 subunit O